jgi:CheY-like chemotaxis protein
VAEDNLINQKVVVGVLEAAGHQVAVVGNGKEAVAALEHRPFDAILMDVQMPEMDGFQATRAIRQAERGLGQHRPIIALTARAMKGDQERCLAAGMDGYVTKPIQPAELFRVLADCVAAPNKDQAAVSGAPPVGTGVLDDVTLRARVGGNVTVLVDILALCPGELDRLMAQLAGAVAAMDAPGIQRAAHTLTGTLGSLSAAQAHATARHLEVLGRTGDLDGALEEFRLLQTEVERVKLAVTSLHSAVMASRGIDRDH